MGQPNDAGELIQVISDSMLVIIPKYVDILGSCSRILTSTLALRIPMVVNLKERKSKEQLREEPRLSVPNFALASASVWASFLKDRVGQSVHAVPESRSIVVADFLASSPTTMSD